MNVSRCAPSLTPEAHHFRESARDQGHSGVGAEAHAVGNAATDRNDILDRAADFHADDVGLHVSPKIRTGETSGEFRCRSARRARRPSLPSVDQRRLPSQTWGRTARRPAARPTPPGRPGAAACRWIFRIPWSPRRPECPGSRCGRIERKDNAKRIRRHGDHGVARALQRTMQIGLEPQCVRKSGVRQVSRISALLRASLSSSDGIASPKRGRVSFARELNRECRAPGAGADNRHRFRALAWHRAGFPDRPSRPA